MRRHRKWWDTSVGKGTRLVSGRQPLPRQFVATNIHFLPRPNSVSWPKRCLHRNAHLVNRAIICTLSQFQDVLKLDCLLAVLVQAVGPAPVAGAKEGDSLPQKTRSRWKLRLCLPKWLVRRSRLQYDVASLPGTTLYLLLSRWTEGGTISNPLATIAAFKDTLPEPY